MTTDIKELLPCPFCKEDMTPVESGIGHVFVHTAGNECWLRSVTIFPHEFEAWNRRAPIQLSAQTAEPEIWKAENPAGVFFYTPDYREIESGMGYGYTKITPLYTHPAKTEQPSLIDAWDRLRSALDDHYKASYRFGEGTNRPDYDDTKRAERVIIDLFSELLAQRQDSDKDADYMCPNCVTPWKCNGPHIANGAPK